MNAAATVVRRCRSWSARGSWEGLRTSPGIMDATVGVHGGQKS